MFNTFPDPNRKTGVVALKKLQFLDCFLSNLSARTGQNFLSGNLNNSTISVFPPPVFGFRILKLTDLLPLKLMSFQTRSEELSKLLLDFTSNSLARKAPKYPIQTQAQMVFLLEVFQDFLSRTFRISCTTSNNMGSEGRRPADLFVKEIPLIRNFSSSFFAGRLSKPMILEIVRRPERYPRIEQAFNFLNLWHQRMKQINVFSTKGHGFKIFSSEQNFS